jgi:murein DD-endopeptidase MepM/ murein hydrolase activator NlpD
VLKGTDLGLAHQLTTQLEARATSAALESSEPLSEPLLGPVTGEVSSGYGERLDPITGEPAFHSGVDLAAPAGTPVQAAAAGEVVFSGRRGSAGNLVEIRHPDGAKTTYAHLAEIHVDVGETLGAGEILGSVGTSGRTTGPHLHFAVEQDGRAVDPETLWRGPSGLKKPLAPEKIS